MTGPLRIYILGGAACAALCLTSAAAASEATTAASSPSVAGGAGQRVMLIRSDDDEGGPGGSWMGHRRGDPERAATHLRNVLQLTPAQEPALQAYLAALHPPHEGYRHEGPGGAPGLQGGPPPADPAARRAAMDQRRAEMDKRRAEQAALTTPERLDRMIKTMTERAAKRQAQMQAHVAAIKQFYAALTPAQQKAFDALGGARKGGMGYGRGRWIHMGMMDPIGAPLPPSPPIPSY